MLSILNSVRNSFSITKTGLQRKLPKTKSHLQGFTITVVRKKGNLLHIHSNGSSTDTSKSAGVNEHFEVTVAYNGTNPLYSGVSKIWTKLLTNTLSNNSSYGFVGGIVYETRNTMFTRIEITERYETWHDGDVLGRMPRPQHVVWLEIFSKKFGESEKASKFGILSR